LHVRHVVDADADDLRRPLNRSEQLHVGEVVRGPLRRSPGERVGGLEHRVVLEDPKTRGSAIRGETSNPHLSSPGFKRDRAITRSASTSSAPSKMLRTRASTKYRDTSVSSAY